MIRVMIRTDTNSPRSSVLVQTYCSKMSGSPGRYAVGLRRMAPLHEMVPGQLSDGVNPSKASTDIAQGPNLSHGLCMTVTSINV